MLFIKAKERVQVEAFWIGTAAERKKTGTNDKRQENGGTERS